MIAQIGLSILLLGVLFYAWTEYSRAPAIGPGVDGGRGCGLILRLAAVARDATGEPSRYRPRRRSHSLCLGDHQSDGDVEPASEAAVADGADNDADAGDRHRQCAPGFPGSHDVMIEAAPTA